MIKQSKQFNYGTELFSRLMGIFKVLSEICKLSGLHIYIVYNDSQFIRVNLCTGLQELISYEDLEGLKGVLPWGRETFFDGELIAIFLYEEELSSSLEGDKVLEGIAAIEGLILKAAEDIYNQLQVQQQATLIRLLRGLNRQFSKTKAVELVLKFIKSQLSYEAIYLEVNEERRIFIPQYATEINRLIQDGVTVPTQMPVQFYKKMQYITDGPTINRHFPRFSKTLNLSALISMPIFRQGKLIGLLLVYDKHYDKISKNIMSIVKEIAAELTVLFIRIDRQNLNLEKMLGFTALENFLLHPIDENINIEEFLYQILSVIPTVTGMKNCTVAPLNEKGDKLLLNYTTNIHIKNEGIEDLPFSDDKVASLVIESKGPVIVYDALSDPRCNHDLMKRLGILSYIALPISNIHGKVLGILVLDNGEYQAFTKEQIRFFEVISKHIGLMLSNAVYLEELFIKSRYDGLTGLYNRETFELLYTKLYDSYRYEDKKFSVLMLDIDDFKEVNDQYGHQVGDSILREVADSIMNSVRREDIVARYGGEEIIIVLKDSDDDEAKIIAERIRRAVEFIEIKDGRVTVSIGISTFRKDSHDKTKLISIADSCLYEAKRAGKNYVKALN